MEPIERILELIKKRGITEYRVAKDLNLASSAFTFWKSNKNTPSAENLVKIAQYFGVTVDYLLGLEEMHTDPMYGQLSAQEIALVRAFRQAGGLVRLSTLATLASALSVSKNKDDQEIAEQLLQGGSENLTADDIAKLIKQHDLKVDTDKDNKK